MVGFAFKGEGTLLGCERAVAADLDVSVDGPSGRSAFLVTNFRFFAFPERAAIVFLYLISATCLFAMLALHSSPGHSC